MNRELFREILEGNFDQVPPGEFLVDQHGVETVSIGHIGGATAETDQLFATFFYQNAGGKQSSFTWSIGPDGTFSGDIPKGMNVERAVLTRTVLDVVDKVGVGFWRMKEDEFLGQTDPGSPRGEGTGDAEPRFRGVDRTGCNFYASNRAS